jgi:serine/threonine protein phosphatase 1
MKILKPYMRHADRPAGPLLGEGRRVYAIGDVHGRFDCLQSIYTLIEQDKATFPIHECKEIYLGDYVDRGPNSNQVIESLIKRQSSHRAICLSGNHDVEFLSSIDSGLDQRWFRQGGDATLKSYGVDLAGFRDIGDELKKACPTSHISFLRSLPHYQAVDGLFFVHAGIDPDLPVFAQDSETYLWIRGRFLSSTKWHGFLVVHGHTPVDTPEVQPNRIGIDTAAFATGVLTAIVLEADGYRFLSTKEKQYRSFG